MNELLWPVYKGNAIFPSSFGVSEKHLFSYVGLGSNPRRTVVPF